MRQFRGNLQHAARTWVQPAQRIVPSFGYYCGRMTIRLQTAKGREIPNIQESEVSIFERNYAETLRRPDRELRTDVSPAYNCHGLTFASRRTSLQPDVLQTILDDDRYGAIDIRDARAGDIIVYYSDDGDATHSGIVIESGGTPPVPKIVSKWGKGPEFIHRYSDVPPIYGTNHRFYRCRL